MPTPKEIQALVDRFKNHQEEYESGKYNETQLRREFLDPFFKALGWDVTNEKGYSEAYKEVIHEDAIRIGAATKAPDYCFRIGGTRKFFVEAKKPSVNIKDDFNPAFQLRRYAWSAKLPLSILSDFAEFAVYDCRIKPHKTDKPTTGRDLYFTFDQYAEKWDEIAAIFSQDAVLKGSFDKFADSGKGKKGTTTVDEAFLEEIEKWRKELAKNIASRNSRLSVQELNYSVQKIIDRIIFLRICEDRGIEQYGRLLSLINGTKIYDHLTQVFQRADERYNSGLFHFQKEKERFEQPDELTLDLKIDDEIFRDMIGGLYYPESPYEFSALPADILGQVYEQFLGKVIRLTEGHQAKVEDKPEVKKAGGVFYTPTFIVEYIVKNTVGKLCEGKTPKQTSRLRILDPACGSGSFLIGAYQYLLDWHRDWFVNDGPQNHTKELYQGPGGDWRLTTETRKKILLSNIYGVDIDPQAVEVTKLSLLLKVLEGESDQTLKKQLEIFHQRALPDLGSNIKCGNSLISSDYFSGELIQNADYLRKINTFNWVKEFKEVIEKNGFDCVIGNPPYIFTRELITENEKKYFNENYISTQFKINTYLLFVEKSFKLLNEEGCLGFIIPNNWLSLETASEFRSFILKNTRSVNIVNCIDSVFEKASVDTCILIFGKSGNEEIVVSELNDNIFGEISKAKPSFYLETKNHVINYEILKSKDKYVLCANIKNNTVNLREIAEIKNGIQAYTVGEGKPIQTKQMKEKRVYHSLKKEGSSWLKYVDGVDVERYYLGWSKQFVKYGNNLSRPRRPDLFNGPRILVRQIPAKPPYSILACYTDEILVNDNNSMIVKTLDDRYSIKYLLGILNSKLISFWFYYTFGKLQRKIFPQFKVNELEIFPIRSIDFNNRSDISRYKNIILIVDRMIELRFRLKKTKIPNESKIIENQIQTNNKELDGIIYELYGLKSDEQNTVEIF